MNLTLGDHVVYPYHGVAVIERFEERKLNGETIEYVVVRIPHRSWETTGDMLVSIPLDRAEEIGLRRPMTSEEADEVLDVLRQTEVRVPSNWARRFKNHQEKLRSHDVYAVAEVVRNLAVRSAQAHLSAAEKRMYEHARNSLVTELAITWSVDGEVAEARLDEALAR